MKRSLFLLGLAVTLALSATAQNHATTHSQTPLDELTAGNLRFVKGEMTHTHQNADRVEELTAGQHPHSVVVSCSDSRVTPEIIFDQGLGDIFTVRTAGNVMGRYEEGSIEYAVEHAHAKLIVVMGHTHCGAIDAMLAVHAGEKVHGEVASLVNSIRKEKEEKELLARHSDKHADAHSDHDDLPFEAVKANVVHGVKQLRESNRLLSQEYREGHIAIVGAIYHIEDGTVEFLDL